MVVFTCGHCGESVQKPKVEKHYLTKCRNQNPNLSCMDCFKDFYGNDYEDHTKCITEEERYSGKGFVAKAKKGEQKQSTWVEMVQSVLNEQRDAPRNVVRIIETVSKHTNTPRKKPKFINFVKNVCGHKTNLSDIEAAWGLISVKLSELSQNNKQNNVNGSNNPSETNNGTHENNNRSVDDASKDDTSKDEKQSNGQGSDNEKKGKSKKEKKEEKKRQKYEAELQSAAVVPEDTVDELTALTKKEKKSKGKSQNVDDNTQDDTEEGKSKNKKRKRKDTVSETLNIDSTEVLNNNENIVTIGEKQNKKKVKACDADNSLSLHDLNVASGEEVITSTQFDWHTTIISVLKKKGNELQFKKLQKKVLGEYSEATGINIDDRIADKFIKKLKSAPNVKVDKNRVVLEE